jgi:hypothetical protein
MTKQTVRPVGAVTLVGLLILALAPTALAHEGRRQGDLEMVVGFGTEPAYAGQPNSVQVVLVHHGQPVVDLGDTLSVEVSFGDETMELPIEPFFAVGEFGEPGDYRAWFIPTRAGRYAFHFSGTIDGEKVDETFRSGPTTFSDVSDPADIQFPVQDPSTGELAERIEREVPRLRSAIDDAGAGAIARTNRASEDASSARALGAIGVVLGGLGLIVAVTALMLSRRKMA